MTSRLVGRETGVAQVAESRPSEAVPASAPTKILAYQNTPFQTDRSIGEVHGGPLTISVQQSELFYRSIRNYYGMDVLEPRDDIGLSVLVTDCYVVHAELAEGFLFDRETYYTNPVYMVDAKDQNYFRCINDEWYIDQVKLGDVERYDVDFTCFYQGSFRNHFHWLVDSLASLTVLHAEYGSSPVVHTFNGRPFSGWQLESLRLLGYDIRNHDGPRGDVVRVKSARFLPAGSLPYIPSRHYRSLADRAISSAGVGGTPSKKLFIRRRDSRGLTNDHDVGQLLRSRGFEECIPDTMSLRDEIALFSQATVILAVHGAGLANMLFSPPSAQIIEIMPAFETRTFNWLLASKLGHRYAVLMAEAETPSFGSALTVPVADLSGLLDLCGV